MRGILPPVSVCRMAIPWWITRIHGVTISAPLITGAGGGVPRGDLQTHRLGLSHVLFRNGDMKTALTGGLQHRIIHNYLDDVLLQGSSRKLTFIFCRAESHTSFWGGGTLNPVFTRGCPGSAQKATTGKGRPARKSVPEMVGECQFQRPVTDRVWWLTSAYAQWSPDRLHGVEQLEPRGESSVRDFKEQYISGNNGGYLRNGAVLVSVLPCHMWGQSVQWLHWTAAGCTLTAMTRTRPAR